MEKLTPRQKNILKELSKNDMSRGQIEESLEKIYQISKATVIRDLGGLINAKLIKQKGSGPAIRYSLLNLPNDANILNLDEYFSVDSDDRKVLSDSFDSSIIKDIDRFFTKKELVSFDNNMMKVNIKDEETLSIEVRKELERLIIELSWKSSRIEGNTYTLLDTENLLKNNIEAPNHTLEERNMILNHKYAFAYIIDNIESFKNFSLSNMIKLHDVLTKGLNINPGLRKHKVGITGTKYRPLDNVYQIEDAITELTIKLEKLKSPVSVAFAVLVFISYLQPFADGNKRVARLMSNGILLSNGYYPLSYRSVNEVEYKKALIVFYEQHIISYFKEIFKKQYKFSSENYYL